jgi:hypothetical protein
MVNPGGFCEAARTVAEGAKACKSCRQANCYAFVAAVRLLERKGDAARISAFSDIFAG